MSRTTVVAIGTVDFLQGFGLAGIRTIEASASTTMELFAQQKGIAIAIIEDSVVASITPAERMTLETSIEPVVIVLSRDATASIRRLDRLISSTIGIDPKMVSYNMTSYDALERAS